MSSTFLVVHHMLQRLHISRTLCLDGPSFVNWVCECECAFPFFPFWPWPLNEGWKERERELIFSAAGLSPLLPAGLIFPLLRPLPKPRIRRRRRRRRRRRGLPLQPGRGRTWINLALCDSSAVQPSQFIPQSTYTARK